MSISRLLVPMALTAALAMGAHPFRVVQFHLQEVRQRAACAGQHCLRARPADGESRFGRAAATQRCGSGARARAGASTGSQHSLTTALDGAAQRCTGRCIGRAQVNHYSKRDYRNPQLSRQ